MGFEVRVDLRRQITNESAWKRFLSQAAAGKFVLPIREFQPRQTGSATRQSRQYQVQPTWPPKGYMSHEAFALALHLLTINMKKRVGFSSPAASTQTHQWQVQTTPSNSSNQHEELVAHLRRLVVQQAQEIQRLRHALMLANGHLRSIENCGRCVVVQHQRHVDAAAVEISSLFVTPPSPQRTTHTTSCIAAAGYGLSVTVWERISEFLFEDAFSWDHIFFWEFTERLNFSHHSYPEQVERLRQRKERYPQDDHPDHPGSSHFEDGMMDTDVDSDSDASVPGDYERSWNTKCPTDPAVWEANRQILREADRNPFRSTPDSKKHCCHHLQNRCRFHRSCKYKHENVSTALVAISNGCGVCSFEHCQQHISYMPRHGEGKQERRGRRKHDLFKKLLFQCATTCDPNLGEPVEDRIAKFQAMSKRGVSFDPPNAVTVINRARESSYDSELEIPLFGRHCKQLCAPGYDGCDLARDIVDLLEECFPNIAYVQQDDGGGSNLFGFTSSDDDDDAVTPASGNQERRKKESDHATNQHLGKWSTDRLPLVRAFYKDLRTKKSETELALTKTIRHQYLQRVVGSRQQGQQGSNAIMSKLFTDISRLCFESYADAFLPTSLSSLAKRTTIHGNPSHEDLLNVGAQQTTLCHRNRAVGERIQPAAFEAAARQMAVEDAARSGSLAERIERQLRQRELYREEYW